jgi:KipI family sensor histidine kinase inhibitor
VRLLPYGPTAVLAEFDTLAEVMAAAAAWRAAALPGVEDVVPAARTVLVVHEDRFDTSLLVPPAGALGALPGELMRVPVRYDGDDLIPVAAAVGVTVDEVIALHTAPEYTCAFCGFMPGFSYLVGLDERLQLPRRATPRTRVPAGAVAIASEFSAVYPGVSPGGWHLLGVTTMVMWDDSLEPAATLPPGTRVRFEAT